MGRRRIPLALDDGDSEPEDKRVVHDKCVDPGDSLTAREKDRHLKGNLQPRELVELRYLIQRDDRFGRALEKTCHAVHEVVIAGNPAPVLAMLAGLVWHCLCLAWEVDAQGGGIPKATLRARVVKLEDELTEVDRAWQKSRRAYFKELCALRDQVRAMDGNVASNIARLVYDEDPVMFYKEVEHLPEDTRMHVAEIVEEKLKQLANKLADGNWKVPAREVETAPSEMDEEQETPAGEKHLMEMHSAALAHSRKLAQQLEDAESKSEQLSKRHEADVYHLLRCLRRDREELRQLAEERGSKVALPLMPDIDSFSLQAAASQGGAGPPVSRRQTSPPNLAMVRGLPVHGGLSKAGVQFGNVIEENASARRELLRDLVHQDSIGQLAGTSLDFLDDASTATARQNAKVAELEGQLSAARLELEKTRNEATRASDRSAAQLEEALKKLGRTEQQVDELSTQNAKLRAELRLANEKLAELRSERHALTKGGDAAATELSRRIDQLTREKEELQAELDALRAELDHLQAEAERPDGSSSASEHRRPSKVSESRRPTKRETPAPPPLEKTRTDWSLPANSVHGRLFAESQERDLRRMRLREAFEQAAENAGLQAFANATARSFKSRFRSLRRSNADSADEARYSLVDNPEEGAAGSRLERLEHELDIDLQRMGVASEPARRASQGMGLSVDDLLQGQRLNTLPGSEEGTESQRVLNRTLRRLTGAVESTNDGHVSCPAPFIHDRSPETTLRSMLSRSRIHSGGVAGFRDATGEQLLGIDEFIQQINENGEPSPLPPSRNPSPAAAASRRRVGGGGLLRAPRPSEVATSERGAALGDELPSFGGPGLAQAMYLQRLAALAAKREAAAAEEETPEEIAARWAQALQAMDPEQFPVRIEGLLPTPVLPSDPAVVDGLRAMVDPPFRESPPRSRSPLALIGERTGSPARRSNSPFEGPSRPSSAAALPALAGPGQGGRARRAGAAAKMPGRGRSETALNQKARTMLASKPGKAPVAPGVEPQKVQAKLARVGSAPSMRRGGRAGGAPLEGKESRRLL